MTEVFLAVAFHKKPNDKTEVFQIDEKFVYHYFYMFIPDWIFDSLAKISVAVTFNYNL